MNIIYGTLTIRLDQQKLISCFSPAPVWNFSYDVLFCDLHAISILLFSEYSKHVLSSAFFLPLVICSNYLENFFPPLLADSLHW